LLFETVVAVPIAGGLVRLTNLRGLVGRAAVRGAASATGGQTDVLPNQVEPVGCANVAAVEDFNNAGDVGGLGRGSEELAD
jgi:hypothetical protein